MNNRLVYKVGNILAEDVEALVNPVNCVGVMGKGLALQFKKAFPDNFKDYKEAWKRGAIRSGKMFVHETGRLLNPRYIVNFPTKDHWRDCSHLDIIEDGLVALVHEIKARDIRSIAIPPLGCGLGGLDWDEVGPCISRAFRGFRTLQTVVFEPYYNASADQEVRA